jgi:PAS domain S-box-containing protein
LSAVNPRDLSDQERQLLVNSQLVRIVHQHIRPGIIATILNAAILCFAHWNTVDHLTLISWFTFIVLTGLLRMVLVVLYWRNSPTPEQSHLWANIFIVGAALSGLGWGLAALLLMPEAHIAEQSLTVIVIAGTVAGANSTLSPLMRAYVLFLLLTMVALIIKLFLIGTEIHQLTAAIAIIFFIFMYASAKRNSETLTKSLILADENSILLQNLETEKHQAEKLNDDLKNEITHRVDTEKELKRKELNLEEAQRIARLGSWEYDLITGRVHLSLVMTQLLGIDSQIQEIDYQKFLQYIVTDDQGHVQLTRDDAIDNMKPFRIEYRVNPSDGHNLVLEEHGIVRLDDSGTVVGLTATAHDITERKKMERLKNEFISTVSHELRTPLTSISGTLGLLKSGAITQLPEKANELITVAERNSVRLTHLVNDILDIDKLEFGGLPLNISRIDLIPVVKDAIEENLGYAERLQVQLVLHESPDEVYVNGDNVRLIQVLTNLISNAAKYSPQGETVTIRVLLVDQNVRVEVADHGPGIVPEFRDQVFQKFSQGDTSDSRFQYGTGLGLNIAKLIVDKHHGKIGFDTEMGQGTTFWFELPSSEA